MEAEHICNAACHEVAKYEAIAGAIGNLSGAIVIVAVVLVCGYLAKD
jgi:hypothetical protein